MSTPTLVRTAPSGTRVPAPARLQSLDVVRGLAVVGMLLVNNAGTERGVPEQLRHGAGGVLHLADLVFPLFLFVSGVGMSLSRRLAAPKSVLRRCALLFGLGCLLVSARYRHLAPSTGVLQHIALATLVAYGVLRVPRRAQAWVAGAGLLAAWAAPTYLSLPGTVAGSWDVDTTLASAVERLLTGHVGKQQVVAAVVSALTVLGGVATGRVLRAQPGVAGVRSILLGAAGAGAAGLLLARSVPVVETLWTPSYLLVTGALCAALLAAAVALLDLRQEAAVPRLVHPLRVLGANAIAVYVVTTSLYSGLLAPVRDELLQPVRLLVGERAAALGYAGSSVVLGWVLCQALWRRRVFLRL